MEDEVWKNCVMIFFKVSSLLHGQAVVPGYVQHLVLRMDEWDKCEIPGVSPSAWKVRYMYTTGTIVRSVNVKLSTIRYHPLCCVTSAKDNF